jgi:hypothetical protein
MRRYTTAVSAKAMDVLYNCTTKYLVRFKFLVYYSTHFLTSFWTGRFAKEHRTHTVNSILKNAHFLVILPRAPWHGTRRVMVCFLPHSLVFGQDCLYNGTYYSSSNKIAIRYVYWPYRILEYLSTAGRVPLYILTVYRVWYNLAHRFSPQRRVIENPLGGFCLTRNPRLCWINLLLLYYGTELINLFSTVPGVLLNENINKNVALELFR